MATIITQYDANGEPTGATLRFDEALEDVLHHVNPQGVGPAVLVNHAVIVVHANGSSTEYTLPGRVFRQIVEAGE